MLMQDELALIQFKIKAYARAYAGETIKRQDVLNMRTIYPDINLALTETPQERRDRLWKELEKHLINLIME